MSKFIDLTGKRFGRLIAREKINNKWSCKCDCGNITEVLRPNLKSGNTKSCGCISKEFPHNYKHGMRHTQIYRSWLHMKERCTNKRCKDFKNWGGRGIKCLWKSFEEFRDDMYESYQSHIKKFEEENTSIDRIDNNGDYCKENCRWATRTEQSRNKRNSIYFKFRGQNKSMPEWCEILGMPYKAVQHRYYRGWSVERILTIPIKRV